ncbi:MAG: 2Fe-2S iron-sulfur cluster binding domain-containing protein [Gammaproteobacteria bacterium]|nr:2Fe-2S iron-sulfur cluster binding domain-containing protein [Gammaproteobacteria bacterium]
MPKITYIDVNGNECTCDVPSGISVMEGAIQNGIEGILAICGGSCACSTCHAYVDERWMDAVGKPDEIEDSTLELAVERRPNSRLTCQIEVSDALDGLVVRVANNDG